MSQQSVYVARRCIDAYNRRDVDELRALNDPDVEVDWRASRGVDAGVYRGHDAVLRFYSEYFDGFSEIVIEPDRFIDAGEDVVVPNVARVRGRDGIEAVARSALVFTIHERKLTRLRLFQELGQALEAVGLAE